MCKEVQGEAHMKGAVCNERVNPLKHAAMKAFATSESKRKWGESQIAMDYCTSNLRSDWVDSWIRIFSNRPRSV